MLGFIPARAAWSTPCPPVSEADAAGCSTATGGSSASRRRARGTTSSRPGRRRSGAAAGRSAPPPPGRSAPTARSCAAAPGESTGRAPRPPPSGAATWTAPCERRASRPGGSRRGRLAAMSVMPARTATELAFAGAARQAEMVRAKEVSPSELVELYLERIDRAQRPAERLQGGDGRAGAADAAAAPRSASPPVSERRCSGSRSRSRTTSTTRARSRPRAPPASATPASTTPWSCGGCETAGAIVLGKTNLPELAIYGFTESPTWGVTRNPWNPARHAAAARAAAAAPPSPPGWRRSAHGTDGAGSIRIPRPPAAPVRAQASAQPRLLRPAGEHWHGLSVYGFVSRTVNDTRPLLDTVTPTGPPGLRLPPPLARPLARRRGPRPGKLRIASPPRRSCRCRKATDVIDGGAGDG